MNFPIFLKFIPPPIVASPAESSRLTSPLLVTEKFLTLALKSLSVSPIFPVTPNPSLVELVTVACPNSAVAKSPPRVPNSIEAAPSAPVTEKSDLNSDPLIPKLH